jgi:hypothetical protein
MNNARFNAVSPIAINGPAEYISFDRKPLIGDFAIPSAARKEMSLFGALQNC